MILTSVFYLAVGFLLLVKGADFFVDGASAIAKKLRIPSFVIGLTIVAFGTSAPELAVSLSAAVKGSNDIAIGNVVGSNMFNTLVVLGASAAITPIAVEKSIIKKDFPLSIGVTILLGVLAVVNIFLFHGPTMMLGRIDGIILLLVFVGFMYTTVRDAFRHRTELQDEAPEKQLSVFKSILFSVLGLGGIIIGGDLTVDGAKDIALAFGLSEALIGLTIVAIGTSLPELVTSIVAARKGESDIAVGNAIGSNIFNILFILGTSATILPMNVSLGYVYDITILLIVSAAVFFPVAWTRKISRGMGLAMIAAYAAYAAYLILR